MPTHQYSQQHPTLVVIETDRRDVVIHHSRGLESGSRMTNERLRRSVLEVKRGTQRYSDLREAASELHKVVGVVEASTSRSNHLRNLRNHKHNEERALESKKE